MTEGQRCTHLHFALVPLKLQMRPYRFPQVWTLMRVHGDAGGVPEPDCEEVLLAQTVKCLVN